MEWQLVFAAVTTANFFRIFDDILHGGAGGQFVRPLSSELHHDVKFIPGHPVAERSWRRVNIGHRGGEARLPSFCVAIQTATRHFTARSTIRAAAAEEAGKERKM